LARKAFAVVLSLVVGLALPVFLLLADIEVVAYHFADYRDSFIRTGASAATGLTVDQLVWTIRRTVDYATGRRTDLQFDRADLDHGPPGRPAFSRIELEHMVDVRALFALGRKVRWAALVAAVVGGAAVIALGRRRGGPAAGAGGAVLARGLLAGAALFLGLWAVLAGAVLAGFSSFWTSFHEVLFSNNLWLLPADCLLIEMLPESLFQRLALEVVGLLAVELAVVIFASALYLRGRPSGCGDRSGRKGRGSIEDTHAEPACR